MRAMNILSLVGVIALGSAALSVGPTATAAASATCDGRAVTVNLNVAGHPNPNRAASDVILGRPTRDIIHAGAGNDVICGNGREDELHGGPGNDRLIGGVNTDHLYGGPGNDYMDGGPGTPDLPGGMTPDEAWDVQGSNTFNDADSDLIIRLDKAKARVDANLTSGVIRVGSTLSRIRNASATGGYSVFGGKFADRLVGTNGSNGLEGGAGRDKLFGRGGDDRLSGGAGNDLLEGGAGNDNYHVGIGWDTIRDLLGANSVGEDWKGGYILDYSRSPAPVTSVGLGLTEVRVGGRVVLSEVIPERVKVIGSRFGDSLRGYTDVLGGPGNDTLVGTSKVPQTNLKQYQGRDRLIGGSGNDMIRALGGNDFLSGGSGADRLNGNSGFDVCAPGSGKNVLRSCEKRIRG